MQSDTAKAKQAVLAYMERQGQATTAELGEVIAQVLGDGFTEGKAAGAIRMCVEEAGSPIIRLGRGLYQYRVARLRRRLLARGLGRPEKRWARFTDV